MADRELKDELSKGGIEESWRRFFSKTNTLAEIERIGYAYVAAADLKAIARWEPRLLAKQDTLEQRPEVFQEHALGILPVRNGQYVLFRDPNARCYFEFSADDLDLPAQTYVSKVRLADYDTYPRDGISSENQALDFAYVSSLLRKISGEERLDLVLRGRSYSGEFDFVLPGSSHRVNVRGVQIEVDGGYESPGSIYVMEAKIGRRPNFHLRQLYFPYLEWKHRSRKAVVPIFVVYTNSRYYFYRFSFADELDSARLESAACLVVDDQPVAAIDLQALLRSVHVEREPVAPFPQANDLDKVIDTLALLSDGVGTKQELADAFEFDERQGDYYGNAARYLGLADKHQGTFALTEEGRRLLGAKGVGERRGLILRQLLKRPVFREAIRVLAAHQFKPDAISEERLASVMQEETSLTGSTLGRRASTVRSWLNWLINNANFV